jgi:hypothetical protein
MTFQEHTQSCCAWSGFTYHAHLVPQLLLLFSCSCAAVGVFQRLLSCAETIEIASCPQESSSSISESGRPSSSGKHGGRCSCQLVNDSVSPEKHSCLARSVPPCVPKVGAGDWLKATRGEQEKLKLESPAVPLAGAAAAACWRRSAVGRWCTSTLRRPYPSGSK